MSMLALIRPCYDAMELAREREAKARLAEAEFLARLAQRG